MENVLFCASVKDNPDQLFYTCRDNYNDRWLCHLFVVKNCTVRIYAILYYLFVFSKIIMTSVQVEYLLIPFF